MGVDEGPGKGEMPKQNRRGELIGPDEGSFRGEKNNKMNLRERGGGGGGGDHFDVNTASANEIESEMNQRLEKVERSYEKPEHDEARAEAVYELVNEMLNTAGKERSEIRKIHELRDVVQAKLACLAFFHGSFRPEAGTSGATGLANKNSAKMVDDGKIFSILLKDKRIAAAFGKLVDAGVDSSKANVTWNSLSAELERKAKNSNWAEFSPEMYAWMLWDISFMHAEADDPDFVNATDEYPSKSILNIGKYLTYEGIDLENRAFLDEQVIELKAWGVDPTDAMAAKSKIKRQKYPNSLSVRTGEVAKHSDLFDLGDYFCWNGAIDWKKQESSVLDIIYNNQDRLRRVRQDQPRGVDEMKGINWFELNLTPGEGLVPESYRLYVWMRRQSEYTLGWIRDQVIPSRAKWQNAENLSVVTSAVLGAQVYKDWVDRERAFTEAAAFHSELLWNHAMRFEAAGMLRDKEMGQRVNGYCSPGGDGRRDLELWGRTFSERVLRDTPISPRQAAFMLLRMYCGTTKGVEADGNVFSLEEILNKAADEWGWQDYLKNDGHGKQKFSDYLRELETTARKLDNHKQGIDILPNQDLRNNREKVEKMGLKEEDLSWTISAIQAEDIRDKRSWRMAFLMGRFSYPIYRYAMYQYTFIEDLIKTGIGYHEADENGIYWKQREFEQIWGGMLINLRNFTEDGKGDRFAEFVAGERLVGPASRFGEDYKHKYIPPEDDKLANALLYLEGMYGRKIEYAMLLLSEDFASNVPEYWIDPENPRRKLYSWEAVGDVGDRHLIMQHITEVAEGADFFTGDRRKELRKRFHCTRPEVEFNRRVREYLGLPPPLGDKSAPSQTESKGKGLLGSIPFIGPYLGWAPLPRSATEWGIMPFGYALGSSALNLAVNPLLSLIKIGSTTAALSLGALGGLSLAPAGLVFFELSLPYLAGVLALRWLVMPIIRALFRGFEKIPGLRYIGARGSKVELGKRFRDMTTRM